MPLSHEEIEAALRGLSPGQCDIYRFIRRHTDAHGVGPTARQLAAAFPVGTMPRLMEQLRAIERAGLIRPGYWSWGDFGQDRVRRGRPRERPGRP